jgi:hypothetical protein
MGLKERSEERRKRLVGRIIRRHVENDPVESSPRASSPRDREAEERDFDFWQSVTPQQRVWAQRAASQHIYDALGPNVDRDEIDNVTFSKIARELLLHKMKERP